MIFNRRLYIIDCSNCGSKKIDQFSNFCVECGFQLDPKLMLCKNCKQRLKSNWLFCKNCGTRITVVNVVERIK